MKLSDPNTHSKWFIYPQITLQQLSVHGRGLFLEKSRRAPTNHPHPHNLLVNLTTVVNHIGRYIPLGKLGQSPIYASINRAYELSELSDDDAARFYRQLDLASLESFLLFEVVLLS